ncbi:hypothetical protein [Blastopirellula marina]|uniref:EamA domain-containing protein n=1 Tax=Blastopirellula marina TaxID=124 RepID=A0A2S8FD49_9BACT|nr:hypothetical protein [Blastopirellula marina]PQO30093.1 hypothetical protein C5Y98_21305 [Blastopirellula marina]PQO43152.1 hypothetical protein C5Y93_25950 [Blastopirellula marina]PTL42531.1 hypothetical protein C5Y97_21315 [Blastopirellula marina]
MESLEKLLFMLSGVALTAICWGSYGAVLHEGQAKLGGSFKPLICVGFAYFVVAILIPGAILASQGKLWTGWSFSGIGWSSAAGVCGTLGALGIILAFSAGSSASKPWIVMPLVFGTAPIIITVISMTTKGLWSQANPFYYAGLILIVVGAVTLLFCAPRGKPAHAADHAPSAAAADHGQEADAAKPETAAE